MPNSRAIAVSARSPGLLVPGRVGVEQVGGGADHLLGGGRAALVAAGAVGEDHERRSAQALARDDRDAILLLLPVADVLAGGRVDRNGHYGEGGRKASLHYRIGDEPAAGHGVPAGTFHVG